MKFPLRKQTLTYAPDYDLVQSIFTDPRPSKAVHFFLCCILKVLFINKFVWAVHLLFMSRCSSVGSVYFTQSHQHAWADGIFKSRKGNSLCLQTYNLQKNYQDSDLHKKHFCTDIQLLNSPDNTCYYLYVVTFYFQGQLLGPICTSKITRVLKKNLILILKRTGGQLKVRLNNNKFFFGAVLFHKW